MQSDKGAAAIKMRASIHNETGREVEATCRKCPVVSRFCREEPIDADTVVPYTAINVRLRLLFWPDFSLLLLQLATNEHYKHLFDRSRMELSTACGHRMDHRKWKETKQEPSMWPGPAVPGCSLFSFHFL